MGGSDRARFDRAGGGRTRAAIALALGLALASGCTAHRPAPAPAVSEGIASWYGPGFHGKRTTNGEVYDQEAMTAAHPTWPLGTRVRVTNLANRRSVVVRINDRGPFVGNRAIDLSHAAAVALGIVGPGTARVRLQPLIGPRDSLVVRFAVQVAAFGDEAQAQALRRRLARSLASPAPYVAAVDSGAGRVWRVRVGPFAARGDAETLAARLASDGDRPVVVEENPAPP